MQKRFALFVRECISMATLVCAHGTANLTNRGPSELVEERIFHALQVRKQTYSYKKNDHLKNIFVVYSITKEISCRYTF